MNEERQPTRTEAIKRFLEHNAPSDLAALYNYSMECQINVGQDGGERVDKTFNGRTYMAWTDGTEEWKPIRIPRNAATEPEYEDRPMSFDLTRHAEGIGMTGWDWQHRVSRWVAFDFDAITGHAEAHSKKLSDDELRQVENIVKNIPWVTLRYSTSGKGLHLYVFLDEIPTANHNEHAALARSILGQLSALVGYDFNSKVDVCGGNLWCWHRKMRNTNGLVLIKQGGVFKDVPSNWRDHITVVKGNRRRVLPSEIRNQTEEDAFEELTNKDVRIDLDKDHRTLLEFLNETGATWWYDNDRNMLVTHTWFLAKAHEELGLRGVFKTLAQGTDRGSDHNCFSGQTEFLTLDGPRTLRESVGPVRAYVLTDNGMEWVDAEVRSFGLQDTVPIYFGDGHYLRATENHQWLFFNSKGECEPWKKKSTLELKPSKTQLPLAPLKLPNTTTPDYWEGYCHGFVFGDGWLENDNKQTDVALFGEKVAMKDLLLTRGTLGSQLYSGIRHDVIRHLPNTWKSLPGLNKISKSYALGFVLGLVTADGSVDTKVQIFNSDRGNIEEIRKLAIYADLRLSNNIRRVNPNSGSYNQNGGWALSINTYNLTQEHFVRADHQRFFKSRIKNSATTVSFLGSNRVEEEVFCLVVPHWHNFTLANGVITGNCFCFPLRRGSWAVRRFTPGVAEDPSWFQDGAGWTKCYLNRDPDLDTTARFHGGKERPTGGFQFGDAESAAKAAVALGAEVVLPNRLNNKKAVLKQHKDGHRIVMEIERSADDPTDGMKEWIVEKNKLVKVLNVKFQAPPEPEVADYDDTIRHMVNQDRADAGWVINSNGWTEEPLANMKLAMAALGHKSGDANLILGTAILKNWQVVNIPFGPEYPGNRQWNRNAAQLRFQPSYDKETLEYPTWLKMLNHLGQGLDDAVKQNPWCINNGIITGGDYLKCWVASMFQKPLEQLPYLFLFSEAQNTGKSTLVEALSLLMTRGAVVSAATALTSDRAFNGELASAVLCFVEELDLSKKGKSEAYNRVKEWTTGKTIQVHAKNLTPYTIPNSTHWIQMANSHKNCPIFPGDTRIVAIEVQPISPLDMIPKTQFLEQLTKEAPDFLAAVLKLELPPSNDRLNIPVLNTELKEMTAEANSSLMEQFIRDEMHFVDGNLILFKDFCERFREWAAMISEEEFSNINIRNQLPTTVAYGASHMTNQRMVGNVSFTPAKEGAPHHEKIHVQAGKLWRGRNKV